MNPQIKINDGITIYTPRKFIILISIEQIHTINVTIINTPITVNNPAPIASINFLTCLFI